MLVGKKSIGRIEVMTNLSHRVAVVMALASDPTVTFSCGDVSSRLGCTPHTADWHFDFSLINR
jgi:hypothetical protein